MRRSAAPSSQSATKRMRFLSPVLSSSFEIEESDIFKNPTSEIDTDVLQFLSNKPKVPNSPTQKDTTITTPNTDSKVLECLLKANPENDSRFSDENTPSPENKYSKGKSESEDPVRSTEEILNYLFEPVTDPEINDASYLTASVHVVNSKSSIKPLNAVSKTYVDAYKKVELPKYSSTQEKDSETLEKNILYYNVLYCKRSSKKHKLWEGDGVLIIQNRSAMLKDTLGKIIDRGIGYKQKEIESIEEGGKFFIGSKECEIQSQMSPEEYKNQIASELADTATCPSPPKVLKPFKQLQPHHPSKFQKPATKKVVHKYPLQQQGTNVSFIKNATSSSFHPGNEVLDYLSKTGAENNTSFANKNSLAPEKKAPMHKVESKESVRSTEDILKYLFDPVTDPGIHDSPCHTASALVSNSETLTQPSNAVSRKSVDADRKRELPKYSSTQEKDSTTLEKNSLYYNVLYCKRSSKKQKVWEGDGVLIIQNQSAMLKNTLGKIIDRGIGYKLKELENIEEGGKFFIGGKECEIQSQMSLEEYENLNTSESVSIVGSPNSPKSFESSNDSSHHYLKFQVPTLTKEVALPETYIVMPEPPLEHQNMFNKEGLPLTTVKIDTFLQKQLRSHQIEGIIFMYKCILGFQHNYGNGVILADEMGLGKTLQCIALIWTLFKQGPYGRKPILKQAIILTPSSLVSNWKNEFSKWLGPSRLSIYHVDKKHSVKDYLNRPKAVLIISYEQFLRSSKLLASELFDLVVCDEGHRIKNINIKISNVVNCLSTQKRILLTGTPIQNDLSEYFSIVDFVNPGALGTLQSFRRNFEKPILLSRDPECTKEGKQIGEDISEELNKISSEIMLRRTQEVINQYLPSKSEIVVFCRPSELQRQLYKLLLNTGALWRLLASGVSDPSIHLMYISYLRKLCNHPALLHGKQNLKDDHILNCLQSTFPSSYSPSPHDSGKMKVLLDILKAIFSHTKKEKVVIVSGFTQTLNLIEGSCRSKGYLFLRLDGSTATSSRQELVDVFNRSYTKYSIFLLSSKAGGVGFNLIGASRIVLYDIDWNPANDLQAMARIWRDGQKNSVFVYRLLTTGTIEEKIYQRQISKQCLSGSVLSPNSNENLKFSRDELKDLFTLHEDTLCLTHDLINCDCLNEEDNVMMNQIANNASENLGMRELMNWKHISGPINQINAIDFSLSSSGSDISFLLVNNVNYPTNTH